jgi:hypothetical protein
MPLAIGFALATIGLAAFFIAWFLWAVLKRIPYTLRDGENLIAEEMAYLFLDGGRRFQGKSGRIVLTDQRILWLPSPFPCPRLEEQEILITDVQACTSGQIYWPVKTVRVTMDQHRFDFCIGFNTLGSTKSVRWRLLIENAVKHAEPAPPSLN